MQCNDCFKSTKLTINCTLKNQSESRNTVQSMNTNKMDTNCNEVGRIDCEYMNITRAEGIEHGCVSAEQQVLVGQQSATAKGNEVREKISVSEVPRRKRTKDSWTKEENRKLWECYLWSK